MGELKIQPVEVAAKPAEAPAYREVPYNIEAEQAVLGAVLTNNDAFNRVGDFLRPAHFYEPVHCRIFEAIIAFMERGLIANPVTLRSRFEKDEALADIGGASYLAKIAGLASGIINVKDYARVVHDLHVSRSLIGIGQDILDDAYAEDGHHSSSEQIERAEHKLFTLAGEGGVERNFSPLREALKESLERANLAFNRQGAVNGVPTGLKDLDELLGGLQKSDLVILAARPSMGKTALAISMAINAVETLVREAEEQRQETDEPRQPGAVGVFSLEMSAEQLAARLLAIKTGINANSIRRGRLHKDEFARLVEANKALYTLPMFIDDTPALTISAIRTRARRMKRKHNLALLVVDYLQLIRGVSEVAQSNRVQEISEITMGLKAIAKELDIPVLALSQLSRAVEGREDKRPQLSDLRESGSIEQDADIVMFIYREEYYLERSKPRDPRDSSDEGAQDTKSMMMWLEKNGEKYNAVKGKAEIMVSKHRNGPIGNVELFFDKTTTRFGNLAHEAAMEDVTI